MNSKQRRARIRAGMPGVVHRILTMKLMGDLTDSMAERYLMRLQDNRLRFADFEKTVRAVAELERQAEMNRTLKTYITSRTGRTQSNTPVFQTLPRTGMSCIGKSARVVVIDEVTQIK